MSPDQTCSACDPSSEQWSRLLEISSINDVKQFWRALVGFIQDVAPHKLAVASVGYSAIVFDDGEISYNSDDAQALRIGQIYNELRTEYVLGVSTIVAQEFRATQAFYHSMVRARRCEQLTVLSVPELKARGKVRSVASIVLYHEADASFARLRALETFHPYLERMIQSFLVRSAKIAVQVGLNEFASNLPVGMLLIDYSFRPLFINTEGYRQSYLWNVAPSVNVLSDYKTVFCMPLDIAEAAKELRFRWSSTTLLLTDDDRIETVVVHPFNRALSATIKAVSDRANPFAFPNFLVRYSAISIDRKTESLKADNLNISLLAELTSAERRVAVYVVRGYSNKEISELLGRQISTIKEHLSHIYGKLNVRSRTHLISRLLDRPTCENEAPIELNGLMSVSDVHRS